MHALQKVCEEEEKIHVFHLFGTASQKRRMHEGWIMFKMLICCFDYDLDLVF